MNKKIAIYPGTFDPITNGHIDMIKRGLDLFDEIIIGVSTGLGKKTFFDLDDRKQMVEKVFENNANVKVVSFDGLLVNTANKYDASIVLRGLRTVSDFEYEYNMANINKKLDNSVQTVFLTPNEKFSCISSTMIKAIAVHDYSKILDFVPENVYEALCNKIGNK
jgi:pantetheine-phosphate adenylyltransferase